MSVIAITAVYHPNTYATLAFEITANDGNVYFVARDPNWLGIQVGPFPTGAGGEQLSRIVVARLGVDAAVADEAEEEPLSNWFGWDAEHERITYQKTEDYVFGNAGNITNNPKRIGDMTRDEMIHAIASFNYESDQLAAALLRVAPSEAAARGLGVEFEYRRAQIVLQRSKAGGGPPNEGLVRASREFQAGSAPNG